MLITIAFLASFCVLVTLFYIGFQTIASFNMIQGSPMDYSKQPMCGHNKVVDDKSCEYPVSKEIAFLVIGNVFLQYMVLTVIGTQPKQISHHQHQKQQTEAFVLKLCDRQ